MYLNELTKTLQENVLSWSDLHNDFILDVPFLYSAVVLFQTDKRVFWNPESSVLTKTPCKINNHDISAGQQVNKQLRTVNRKGNYGN